MKKSKWLLVGFWEEEYLDLDIKLSPTRLGHFERGFIDVLFRDGVDQKQQSAHIPPFACNERRNKDYSLRVGFAYVSCNLNETLLIHVNSSDPPIC
jgi:hypothetical protein